jgi:hypothetical protein
VGKEDAEGWIHTDWSVVVPDDANGLALKLGVRQLAGEKTWFDNIMIIPLEINKQEN